MTESAGLYAMAGLVLAGMGLHAALVQTALLRKVLALDLMSAGVFLVLIAVAYRGPEASPDPVPHALVLTGIVVAVSATGLALALIRRLGREDEDAD